MARKQLEIVGTERDTIADIEEAAGPYVATMYKRMELQKKEEQLRAQLHERMKSNRQKLYVFFDADDNQFDIKLESKAKLSVKRRKPQDAPDGAESDDE